jgi:type IV pilus assembly protein PilB
MSQEGLRFGELLVRDDVISEEQLQQALEIQQALPAYRPIGQVLVYMNALTRDQLQDLLERYEKWPRLGTLLLAAKVITQEQLDAALAFHRQTNLRLGDCLVQLGFATDAEVTQALANQSNVPFVSLEDAGPAPGPELAQLVPREFAEGHLVVPIARVRDTLTIAMRDPTNAAVVEQLEALTGCRINVVTCTRADFEQTLQTVYEEPV